MATHVVEELVSKIRMDAGDYLSNSEKVDQAAKSTADSIEESEKRGKKSHDDLGESSSKLADNVEESSERQTAAQKKAAEESEEFSKQLSNVFKALAALYVQIKSSQAIVDLANQTSRLNTQLDFMSRRLGTATADIRRMSIAADALGGSGDSMVGTLRDMNQSIQEMTLTGDSSLIPFMSALGVALVDNSGNAREASDVLLDVAEALEKIDPRKAYALASMHYPDEIANVLVQGRDAMEEMIAMQGDVYVSNETQLQASRDLIKAQALLESRWVSLQTVIGNAVTPALTTVVEITEKFINFLVENEHAVTGALMAIGTVITATLIPAIRGLFIMLAPIAGKIAVVAALGLAFVALYDDYKVWSEGGESLFDWEKFQNYFKNSQFSVENLGQAFLGLVGNYESWEEAYNGFREWLEMAGIIDNGALSIRGLASAFASMVGDLIQSTGLLQDFAQILQHIQDGEYMKAARVVGNIAMKAGSAVYELTGEVAEGAAGFVDRAAGHNPEDDGTLSSAARATRDFGRGLINNAGEYVRGDAYESTGQESSNQDMNRAPETVTTPEGEIQVIDLNDDMLNDIQGRINNRAEQQDNVASIQQMYGAGNSQRAGGELIDRTVNIMRGVEQAINPMTHNRYMSENYTSNAESHANSNYVMRDSQSVDNSRNRSVNVRIDEINVRTTATTVTGATSDGIEQAISGRVSTLDLLGAGT